jgi:hypothetical protein
MPSYSIRIVKWLQLQGQATKKLSGPGARPPLIAGTVVSATGALACEAEDWPMCVLAVLAHSH